MGINRVAKTTKGGRTFSFSSIMVVGDEKGRVGHGLSKSREVATAIQKGIEDAKKSVAVLEKDERSNTTTTTKGDDEEHTNFIPLKPFGLCCYKTDPEIWEESDEAENARTAAMIDGAYAFLRSLEVIHPDYEFFSHHG